MAKPQGESKVPIITALVFFVLCTLALGVIVYLDQEKIATANADKKKADDDANVQKKLAAEANEKVLLYRELMGINSQEESSALKNMTARDAVQKEHKRIIQEINDRLAGSPSVPGLVAEEGRNLPGTRFDVKPEDVFSWDWPDGTEYAGPPKRGLLSVVVGAYAKQLLASQKKETAEKNAKIAEEGYQKLSEEYSKAVQALREAAKQFPIQVTEAQRAERNRVEEAIKVFDQRTADYAKDIRDREDANNRLDIEKAKVETQARGLKNRLDRAEETLASREDVFAFEKHHGRILSRKDNIVYIDVGSSAKVRPGLTFTIQPSDTPQVGIDTRKVERILRSGEREVSIQTKGTIEVIEVLGPNQSQARITTENDPIRDGIMVGDTLYNAAWRRGSAEHVALFGVFDLNADGNDDIKTVVKDLQKMGIIVDAYYDLEAKKWQGQITSLTTYTVEGYYPIAQTADALAEAKSMINDKLKEARQFALEQGSKVVKAREFFPRIGYKMRLDITPELINRSYNRYLNLTPGGQLNEEDPGR